MTNNTVTAYRTSSVDIRLVEVQDAAYAQVNDHHFALAVGRPTDISAALNQNFNAIRLVVQNKGTILGGNWMGRFELYVDGKLVGAYADEGVDLRPNQEHLVAELELQIVAPPQRNDEPAPLRITQKLQAVPGMTHADKNHLPKSYPFARFQNGVTIHLYTNSVNVDHVFVTDHTGACLFGGYVGWIHRSRLRKTLDEIRQEYSQYLE
jgi:hypothetical protein